MDAGFLESECQNINWCFFFKWEYVDGHKYPGKSKNNVHTDLINFVFVVDYARHDTQLGVLRNLGY